VAVSEREWARKNPIALFKSEWNMSYAQGRHPDWTFAPTAGADARAPR